MQSFQAGAMMPIDSNNSAKNKLTKRFGIYCGIMVLLLFISNLATILLKRGTIKGNYDQFELLFIGFLLLVTSKLNWGKYVQIFCITLSVIVTLFTEPNEGFAIAPIFILVLLAKQYGFLKHNLVIKIASSTIIFVILMLASLYKSNIGLYHIFPIIIYNLIFFTSFVIIKFDEFTEYFDIEKEYKKEIEKLKIDLTNKENVISKLDIDFINPIDAGLTNAELEILENLCIYKESNNQLSKRLNKSVHTIKSQLISIYNKIGVDDRHQLIELCQNYYKLNLQT